MYFWRINELKNQMRAGPVPARDVLGYVLWLVGSIWLPQLLLTMMSFPEASDVRPPVWPQLVLLVMMAVGLWVAYRANGGASGRDFAGRLLATHWVLGLRFVPAMFFVVIAVVVIGGIAGFTSSKPDAVEDELIVGGVMAASMVLFYWRLAHHLRQVAATSGEQEG